MLSVNNEADFYGKYVINMDKFQDVGSYTLSDNIVNKNNSYLLRLNSSDFTTITDNKGFTSNGVNYNISSSANKTSLDISLNFGEMITENGKMLGTTESDIFYANGSDNIISGVNGRDVVVYDATAWGKDIIKQTSGTMTLVFDGLSEKDLLKTYQDSTLTIQNKADQNQAITIENYDSATHHLVYADNLNEFKQYLNSTSPDTNQKVNARNEVWKAAGLASA